MKPLSSMLQFIFGCRHRHLSRVFTIKLRTYRVCFDCAREFDVPGGGEPAQPGGKDKARPTNSVRGRGAVVPQDSSGARACTHTEGASVSGRLASRDGGIRSARRFRGEEVPACTGRRGSGSIKKGVINA
jgi:hypothetical protein